MANFHQPATSGAGPSGAAAALATAASDTGAAVEERLVERARQLGPLIREHADQGERDRRLARPVVDALLEAGFQRMFTPRSLGGLEVGPVTCARVVEELAGAHSAAGWALQTGNTGAWWCARLSREGAGELFAAGPNALIAASFQPPHQAIEVPGGYRFTGRGPLASTIHDAAWVMMTAFILDDDQPRMVDGHPDVIAVVLRASDVRIDDTWHSLGMRATDSNDAVAEDVFVPASRTFHVTPQFEPGPHFQGPLYRMPAIGSILVVTAPVAMAVARGAITELRELAQRKTAMGFARTLKDRDVVQAALAEAEGTLRSARSFFYETLDAMWQRTLAGEPSTLEQKADLLLAGTHAAKSASTVTELMHRLAGTSGVYARSRLERHFRDAQTVRHHGFVSQNRLETVGQVYLGVTPEFPLVAF